MNYCEFIENILNIRGRFACGDEYHERHHIIPQCMQGNDDENNLIDLFAREHFEAHRLLALENPDNDKLIYAWNMMANKLGCKNQECEITAEEYEEAKKAFSIKSSELHKGKKISEKQRLQISERMSGEKHPMFGKHHSLESRQKISDHHADASGYKNPNFNNYWSDEQKEKLSKERMGELNPKSFAIYCPELNEEFWGAKDAQDKYHIQATGISACLHDRQKTAGKHPITGEKLHWVKVESKNC